MRPGGFEPPTNSLEGCCSIHLSYGRATVLQQVTRGTARRPANGVTNCAKLNAPLPRCAGSRIEESSRAARVYVLSKVISRPELEPPPRREGVHHAALRQRDLVDTPRVRRVPSLETEHPNGRAVGRVQIATPPRLDQVWHIEDVGGDLEVLTSREGNGLREPRIQRSQPPVPAAVARHDPSPLRSEEHTSELQSLAYLVCRLLLEKKKKNISYT